MVAMVDKDRQRGALFGLAVGDARSDIGVSLAPKAALQIGLRLLQQFRIKAFTGR
jgi:hypothetical protein